MTLYSKQVKTASPDAELAIQNSERASQFNPFVTEADLAGIQTKDFPIVFDKDRNYGSLLNPINSDIFADIFLGRSGAVCRIIHKSSVEPSFTSIFKKLSSSGDYATGEINYIFCMFVEDNEIIYNISQRS